ncbi:MAG: hypothetical protein PHD81_04035 [Candidatus Nanoarchaeia archaeon]|nr:hypothetical protein [Candidatus Nanoarchaeia archaeon]MDD5588251.1 hypothetical protein [Candidatus Nanoarchaeia archaeon]
MAINLSGGMGGTKTHVSHEIADLEEKVQRQKKFLVNQGLYVDFETINSELETIEKAYVKADKKGASKGGDEKSAGVLNYQYLYLRRIILERPQDKMQFLKDYIKLNLPEVKQEKTGLSIY